MKTNTVKSLIVLLIIYSLGINLFGPGTTTTIVFVLLIYMLFKTRKRSKKAVYDTTKRGSLSSAEVDALYRLYDPIIDGYKTTPLNLFTKALDKSLGEVVQDLQTLMKAGRFQQAQILDDELVVGENMRLREKAEKKEESPEILSLIDQLLPQVTNEEVREALLSMKESCTLIFGDDFQIEMDQTSLNKFQTFYLPKTIEQLLYYKKLISKSTLSSAQHNALVSVEGAILSISQIFKDYVASVDSAEAFDMEAEAKAIKQMADSERTSQDFKGVA